MGLTSVWPLDLVRTFADLHHTSIWPCVSPRFKGRSDIHAVFVIDTSDLSTNLCSDPQVWKVHELKKDSIDDSTKQRSVKINSKTAQLLCHNRTAFKFKMQEWWTQRKFSLLHSRTNYKLFKAFSNRMAAFTHSSLASFDRILSFEK
jgi:hypothetical protein